MDVIWISSYPRSGNTWLRFLLATYLFGRVEKSLELERLIPNIHRVGALEATSPSTLLCKSHYPLSDRHPHIGDTQGFIYVLRSPKDVLSSNLYYLRMTGQVTQSPETFIREFIEHRGVPLWQETGIGSWVEHVRSWLLGPSRFPGLVLRYEEMLEEPQTALTRAVRFIGAEVDPDRVARATEACSFNQLQELEQREKLGGQPSLFRGTTEASQRGLFFVRSGRSGQNLPAVDSALEEAFDRSFEPFLEELEERLRDRRESLSV